MNKKKLIIITTTIFSLSHITMGMENKSNQRSGITLTPILTPETPILIPEEKFVLDQSLFNIYNQENQYSTLESKLSDLNTTKNQLNQTSPVDQIALNNINQEINAILVNLNLIKQYLKNAYEMHRYYYFFYKPMYYLYYSNEQNIILTDTLKTVIEKIIT